MIECIERYRFDGQEFRDLPAVAKHIENEIGKVIDSTPNRLKPKDALAVFAALVKHRKRLCQMLSATYLVDQDEMQPEEKSIFDL